MTMSEAKFKTAANYSPDALVITDGGRRYTVAQSAALLNELTGALEPFADEALCKIHPSNTVGEESIVFQRNKSVLKIKHFRKAKAALASAKGEAHE
jgi:hypothetical protein